MTFLKSAIKDTVLWLYWYPFRWLVRAIPPLARYRIARILARLTYWLGWKKKPYLEELERIRTLAGGGDVNAWLLEALCHRWMTELDVFLFDRFNPENTPELMGCQGLEHLDAGLQKGRGVMLLFAHFGANQMVMPAIGHRGYTMSQLSANPLVWVEKRPNQHFSPMARKALALRWELELALPVTHVDIFGSIKGAFSCLKRNQVLGIAMDGAGGKEIVEVDFLGRKANFSVGAVEIAHRTGCEVLPTFMVLDETGRYTLHILPPMSLTRDEKGQLERQKTIQDFVIILEKYVLKHPGHYVHFLALRRFMELMEGDEPFLFDEK
ncbi:MAG: lysophospholipid acyltransferase family protein [Magnetococcales bacterium]|nr:lysophospholipid acyltransferase family protein [Magnetococcales bacterium]